MELVKVYKDFPMVMVQGREIFLTQKEWLLFNLLWEHRNMTCTRQLILEKVWMYNIEVETRVVDVYIGYLRKKLFGTALQGKILGIRPFGYRIIWDEGNLERYKCGCNCGVCQNCKHKPEVSIF